jgi:hypothetical protein
MTADEQASRREFIRLQLSAGGREKGASGAEAVPAGNVEAGARDVELPDVEEASIGEDPAFGALVEHLAGVNI